MRTYSDAVLECVGSMQTLTASFGAIRDGGVISRVGVPSYADGPIGMDMIMLNITLTGGVDPARHYIDGILPDVLEGRIERGRVFDRAIGLDAVPVRCAPWWGSWEDWSSSVAGAVDRICGEARLPPRAAVVVTSFPVAEGQGISPRTRCRQQS
jgi:hypothetical protein